MKVLGVLLDQTLRWEPHMSSVVRRTYAILIFLSSLILKVHHHLSPGNLNILIQAHVVPHIHYCSSIWGGATNFHLDRLQRILHFAARLVSGLRKYDT